MVTRGRCVGQNASQTAPLAWKGSQGGSSFFHWTIPGSPRVHSGSGRLAGQTLMSICLVGEPSVADHMRTTIQAFLQGLACTHAYTRDTEGNHCVTKSPPHSALFASFVNHTCWNIQFKYLRSCKERDSSLPFIRSLRIHPRATIDLIQLS